MLNILKIFRFLWEYLYDFILSIRFNTYSPFEDRNLRLYYRLIILSHAVEKGLSLPKPRLLFGKRKIHHIISMAKEYDPSISQFPLQMAVGALSDYIGFHAELGVSDPFIEDIKKSLLEMNNFRNVVPNGGYKRKSELKIVLPEQMEVYANFLKSRYSCRHYEARLVSDELIEKVIETAQSSPSQCNRQSVRIHCYRNKAKIDELLTLQAGASGFSGEIYNLFLVTFEITAWGGYGQRNQGYVDGGLFAEQLILSCHANGIGACPLNLAVSNSKEKRIKIAGGVHFRERVVMMIAFGYPETLNLKGARSARIPLKSQLKLH